MARFRHFRSRRMPVVGASRRGGMLPTAKRTEISPPRDFIAEWILMFIFATVMRCIRSTV